MADGELTLKLDDETARRLREAADAAGLSVDDYVQDLIRDGLDHGDWDEDVRIADESERTGEYVSLEEGLRQFEDDLEARLAAKG